MENQEFFQDTILKMNPLMQDISSDKPMPSNRDILESINKLRETLQRQKVTGQLDPKGQEIASAVDEFLITSEAFIREKNPDEAIQKFIERCISFGKRAKVEANIHRIKNQAETNIALNKLSEVSEHLKHIIQQMFSSSDTRKMMREVEEFIEKCYSLGKRMSDEKRKLSEVPKEQRQEIGKDILKLYSNIGSTPAWKELRSDIMSLYDYSISEKDLVSSSLHREFQLLIEDACDIMNRFTERNVFKLRRMMEETYKTIEKDEEAKEFFSSMRKWTDYIVDHPECADDDKVVKKGDENMELAMKVFEKHSEDFSRIAEELKQVLCSIQNDRFVNRYKDNILGVGESLKGSYLDTIVQLRTLMAPVIGEALKYAKLPRMHEVDSSGSWAVDNITMSGKMSHLDDVVLDFRIGLKNVIEVILTVRQIDIVLKDVDFTYDRISIPAFSDKGKLDVKIYSPGWRLKWVVNQKPGREAFFELADIDGRIKYLDIDIIQANHSWIDSILVNMWIPSLRRRAERAIENMLAEKAAPLTEKLNRFFTSHHHTGIVNPKIREMMESKIGGEATQAREKTLF